jgi:hypothetical protein
MWIHKKILIAFIVLVSIAGSGFFPSMFLWYISQTGDFSKKFWLPGSIISFDQAIFLSQRWDYLSAQSLIGFLLDESDRIPPSRVYELYGDLVYSLSGTSENILPFYERAYIHEALPRIREKIEYLQLQKTQISPSETGGLSLLQKTGSEIGTGKYDLYKKEIERLQQDRRNYMDFSASESDMGKMIDQVFQVLEGGNEKKDW